MRTLRRSVSQFAVFLTTLSLYAAFLPVRAVIAVETVSSAHEISLHELEHGIADRLKRVEEFKFIEQEAAKLGVRAWLFGGTAAGYAHYVKWDMQREKGDPRFQRDRFDYDYTNIYRSTQDLDIVIDGNPGQAQKLQSALQEKYPHLQGSKTAWEVRLLTQDMGDKQAILNNPDFMNQHTDSNSTGMVEITKPHAGESVIRDVRDWTSKEPYFLKDVHDGMLHYYFSPLHESTKFAKEGRNPPILSAIRFLTKAFQYELKIRPEDLEQIKKVIHDFDPKRDTQNSYVANWIEKNGKKLIQNAVNIEYAWDTLEKLGLRQKLIAIRGNVSAQESLAWWLNKEPLRTLPVGSGSGKTAKELGLDVVAHETNNFLAYESITRAHTGDPNVLISRNGAPGEAAVSGDGFYTKVGQEGARGTGLTIRFHLDPNARQGTDFDYHPHSNFVILKNKAALKVIPESLNIGPVEYFEKLAATEAPGLLQSFQPKNSDLGIFEKLKRRIGAKLHAFSPDEVKKIQAIVKELIPQFDMHRVNPALSEWFSLPISTQFPELVESLLKNNDAERWVAVNILGNPLWQNHPELVEELLKKGTVDDLIASFVLSEPHWQNHPEWVEALLKKGNVDEKVLEFALSKPHWRNHPEWIDHLINRGNVGSEIVWYALRQPHWKSHPRWAEWVEKILAKKSPAEDFALISVVLADPASKDHPEWIEDLVKREKPPGSDGSPEMNRWYNTRDRLHEVIEKPHWREHPVLRQMAGGRNPTYLALLKYFEEGGASLRAPTGSCISHQLERILK
jgi:hypothetical protein